MIRPAVLLSYASAAALSLAAAVTLARADTPEPAAVVDAYGDIALAMYEDALAGAKALDAAVDKLIAEPTEDNLKAARQAWLAARPAYQQTEGYRFGNAIVDDWEGRVNAWPLDEGLIDYVDKDSYGEESDENPLYTANVIANPSLRIGPDVIDASKITKELISEKLQEAQGVEANVAIGYHAVEFLLWGQDLNGTGPGAGTRPATDYDTANCTGGNCDRRADYLKAASDLLVDDLEEMVANWQDGGAARKELADKGENGALATVLTGLGSLSYGELAGERIKLGVLLHDPEEEHDCFSDNTQNSHYYDQVGMMAIWDGAYKRTDGSTVEGPSIADFVAAKSPEAAERVNEAMKATLAKMDVMKKTADSGEMAYDQMLAAGNEKGNKILLDVVDSLVAQTRAIEGAVHALNLSIEVEGSDSLDNPSAVQ
ncbi:imelysin family protein [Propylenella binzhouense]|uniref:Peptidase n=1 Tax=Propylenella binzhouense TaxID=2555902 RepID=A0A964WUQ1_9HYPH|nr:imelysin family protein [Propylenella binzhouense]MYZ49264.1 peptidase [Propylenella binzhouense]